MCLLRPPRWTGAGHERARPQPAVRLESERLRHGGRGLASPQRGAACALELWRRKPDGRLVPTATPEEPDIADFFTPGYKLPPGTSPSVMLCLGEEGLEARALLWTSTGLAQVKFDHKVLYRWNGSAFSKVILPADGK